jgi:hypothetical protein
VILGFGSSSNRSSNGTRQGIAYASLNCSSPAGPVPVAISEKHLGQHAQAFQGVTVHISNGCKQQVPAVHRNASIDALLYFCSDQPLQLTLLQPVVRGVALVADFKSLPAENPAFLAFGGNVNATIIAGQFTNNTAGAALVAYQQAALNMVDTEISGHAGQRAVGVLALGAAKVSITNSSFSHNTVPNVVLASNNSRISVISSMFVNNTLDAFNTENGGLLQFEDTSRGVIDSSMISNTTAGQASGLSVCNSSQVGGTLVLSQPWRLLWCHQACLVSLQTC